MALSKVVLQGTGQWERDDIRDFYRGGQKVLRAYLGTDLVYYNAPVGAILSIEVSNPGSTPFGGSLLNGDYLFETLISFGGSGTGGEFIGTIINGILDSITLVNQYGEGQGWTVNNIITIECDQINFAIQPQIRVLSVV